MATILEVKKLALDYLRTKGCPRGSPAGILPPMLQDADEGIAEALRRDAELDRILPAAFFGAF